jgi:hypothetical protein
MGRTKQTARRSTGGKAPRKSHANRLNKRIVYKYEENENDDKNQEINEK